MNGSKSIIEFRDADGKLTSHHPSGFEPITRPEGVGIDRLLQFMNNKLKAWRTNERGVEVGSITPSNVDYELHKLGMVRRPKTW